MSNSTADLSGVDIGKVMSATGPIVKAVLLRCQPETTEDDNQKISAKDSAPKQEGSSTKEGTDESDDESISPEQAAEIRLSTKSLISQITIDTTPKKSMVQHTLGGPFTFLGQYEEEGIMVMIRRPDWETDEDDSDPNNDDLSSPTNNTNSSEKASLKGADGLPKIGCAIRKIPQINPHKLQPPLSFVEVRGDILLMRVAETEEELDEKELEIDNSKEASKVSEEKVEEIEKEVQKQVSVPSNDDFFLDYTKDEYLKFISRTDIEEVDESSDEEEDDSDGEEEGGGLAALLGVGNGEDDEEGEEDEDFDPDEDESVGMMNMILGHLLKKFREENGRGPDSLELLEMRKALADKLGVEVPEVDEEKLTAPVPKSPNRKKVVVDEKKNETSPIPARDEEEEEDGKVVAAHLDSLKRSAVDDDDAEESNKKAKVDE